MLTTLLTWVWPATVEKEIRSFSGEFKHYKRKATLGYKHKFQRQSSAAIRAFIYLFLRPIAYLSLFPVSLSWFVRAIYSAIMRAAAKIVACIASLASTCGFLFFVFVCSSEWNSFRALVCVWLCVWVIVCLLAAFFFLIKLLLLPLDANFIENLCIKKNNNNTDLLTKVNRGGGAKESPNRSRRNKNKR